MRSMPITFGLGHLAVIVQVPFITGNYVHYVKILVTSLSLIGFMT